MAQDGGKPSSKEQFNTKINGEILNAFREKCKMENISINMVIEKFMQEVLEGNITIESEIRIKRIKNAK